MCSMGALYSACGERAKDMPPCLALPVYIYKFIVGKCKEETIDLTSERHARRQAHGERVILSDFTRPLINIVALCVCVCMPM